MSKDFPGGGGGVPARNRFFQGVAAPPVLFIHVRYERRTQMHTQTNARAPRRATTARFRIFAKRVLHNTRLDDPAKYVKYLSSGRGSVEWATQKAGALPLCSTIPTLVYSGVKTNRHEHDVFLRSGAFIDNDRSVYYY